MANPKFTTHRGIAAPILRDNIDTDQIIPSREMRTVSKTGLADGLFAGQRYIKGREPDPNFVLNQPGFAKASVILSGKNFGCGSSREHAVWALSEYGIRAIIAESFGEIFYNNCVRNGILPITLSVDEIAGLGHEVVIDLDSQSVNKVKFEIAENDKAMLMNGYDLIELTLEHETDIATFIEQDQKRRYWIYE